MVSFKQTFLLGLLSIGLVANAIAIPAFNDASGSIKITDDEYVDPGPGDAITIIKNMTFPAWALAPEDVELIAPAGNEVSTLAIEIKCETSDASALLSNIRLAATELRHRPLDQNCLQANYGGSFCTDLVNVNGAQIGVCGPVHVGQRCYVIADIAVEAAEECVNSKGRSGATVWFAGYSGKKVRLIVH